MAWVHLSDLLSDRNYNGILNADDIGEVKLMGVKSELFSFSDEFLTTWDNKIVNIKELFKDFEINQPEWHLRDDGFIASGNLYDVRDDIVWLDFYEIDLRKYLNTFTDEKLKELAELAFWNWDKSCRIIDTEKVEKFIREVRSVE